MAFNTYTYLEEKLELPHLHLAKLCHSSSPASTCGHGGGFPLMGALGIGCQSPDCLQHSLVFALPTRSHCAGPGVHSEQAMILGLLDGPSVRELIRRPSDDLRDNPFALFFLAFKEEI